jgi:rapamycin-insensitive companion of mTOR
MGENRSNQAKIPPHIFGELAKTKKGIELLQLTKHLETFVKDIRSQETSIIQKRASLWALGHIG